MLYYRNPKSMLCETKSDSHLEYIFAYPSSFTLFCNNLPI